MLPGVRRAPIQPKQQPQDMMALLSEFLRLAPQVLQARDDMKKFHDGIHTALSGIKQGPQGPAGTPGRSGRDAPAPDHEAIAEILAKKIKLPRNGKDGVNGRDGKSVDPDEIVDHIVKKKKLKVGDVDGLEQTLSVMRNFHANGGIRGGGDTVAAGTGITIVQSGGVKTISAGASVTTVIGEDLSSQAPGTTFTLAHTPTSGSVRLYRGGTRQRIGASNDYTISGAIITFNTTVVSGEIILVDYTY